ncbi:MAG: site-specific integrase [Planctomycetaceae bacterium]|nr:site-specific integrase [Planctomycetaceae bacterium]
MVRKVKNPVPNLKLHKASGRAYVHHAGKRIYFGKWSKATTTEAYNRWAADLLSGGKPLASDLVEEDRSKLAVFELGAAYLEWAAGHYCPKPGQRVTHVDKIQRYLKALLQCHRSVLVEKFGPVALRRIQDRLVAEGYSRQGVNDLVKGIRGCFKWGVSRELVSAPIYQALCTVAPLHYGRTTARECQPIKPIADTVVNATLPALPEVVADMVMLQRLTGMRPGETCKLRPCDLDRSEDVWLYQPPDHKTRHMGRDRVICIGPRAQEILRPYLLRPAELFCFSPADSERRRRAKQHEERRTPLSCGTKPKGNPEGQAGDQYDTTSYRHAIVRAVNKVNRQRKDQAKKDGIDLDDVELLPLWSPNQLRHAAGTAIRRQFGLESAQVVLGHAKADVTQVYAERDNELAREVARRIG